MSKYKQLPPTARFLKIGVFSCDTDCCGMAHYEIVWMDGEKKSGGKIWEGYAFDYSDGVETQEALDELRLACEFYGIPTEGITEEAMFYLDDDVYLVKIKE